MKRKLFTKKDRPGVLFDEEGNEVTYDEIVGKSVKESRRITITHREPLPKPLREFNELVAKAKSTPPATKGNTVLDEAAKKWEKAGMGPNAARIAATEQLSKLTPEDWIELGEKLFR